MATTPVTVIGEAIVDVLRRDGKDTPVPGGSPLNVAVGCSRLGMPATLISTIGDDADGAILMDHLGANDVAFAQLGTRPVPSNRAIATFDDEGVATYEFEVSWDQTEPSEDAEAAAEMAGHVHFGSIAASVEPGRGVLADLARRGAATDATLSYDPNSRPGFGVSHEEAVERTIELLDFSDVIKVSDADLEYLYPEATVEEVAEWWAARHPAVVVVTRGAEPIHVRTSRFAFDQPAERVEVVDTVGSGDSFMSALLYGLDTLGGLGREGRAVLDALSEEDLRSVVARAAHAAAITSGREGADPPTLADIT